jgi:23S rRNA (uracil1939-C5)-methyltransferase
VLASTRAFLIGAGEAASSCFRAREPFRLVIRRASGSGELLVAIREAGPAFPLACALADHLAARHPAVRGVVRLVRRGPGRGGTRTIVVRGRPWIEERVGRTVFRLPAASFLQVNAQAATQLVTLVGELAGPVAGKRVWDLYGGVGMYGIDLARSGAEVAICDADADAVRAGREACRRTTPGRVRFHHARVGTFLAQRAAEAERPHVVVANPPRCGLDRGGVDALVAARPERIVLVSCDPATLARDLKRLQDGGFRVRRIVPVDLFPQTAHLETVVALIPDGG